MVKASGLFLPLFSLPSPYGIGTLGQAAYDFVDFLAAGRQTYWQLLPLNPTSPLYGNSPYSALSSFAGSPYLLDLDCLAQEGLLEPADYQGLAYGQASNQVDYDRLGPAKAQALHRAFVRFAAQPAPPAYADFIHDQAPWLWDYILFRLLRQEQGGSWQTWPQDLRDHDPQALQAYAQAHQEAVDYQAFLQYEFFHQYFLLKDYASSQGVRLIGDLPLYVPYESAEVWAHAQDFQLDADLKPLAVSGVPPDAYAKEGQLWNHPLYDWGAMAREGFPLWIQRLQLASQLYDAIRLDHFIGFSRYYAVPYGEPTAEHGSWQPGPGPAFFDQVYTKMPRLRLLAEDLGSVTEAVTALRQTYHIPGMRVLEFSLDWRDRQNPLHDFPADALAYSSTHDSNTALGWLDDLPAGEREQVVQCLDLTEEEGYHWGLIRSLLGSEAPLTLFPLQDLLGLGGKGRINVPGQPEGNWTWRLPTGYADPALSARLAAYMERFRP